MGKRGCWLLILTSICPPVSWQIAAERTQWRHRDAVSLAGGSAIARMERSSDDDANFMDHSKVAHFVSEERVIVHGTKAER